VNLTTAAVGNLMEDLARLCDDLEITHRGTQWRVCVWIAGPGAQTFETIPDVLPRQDTAENLLDCLADAIDWAQRHQKRGPA